MPRARPGCGNPLLRDWMAEWMEEAKNMQMKSYYTFKKAYDSLCVCPTPFTHPSEAQQLNGIGPKLAIRLEKRMIDYCEENGLPIPRRHKRGRRTLTIDDDSNHVADESSSNSNKRARTPRPYIPRFRSGGYAILLTLLDLKDEGRVGATKIEIIRDGQGYCDASMDLPEPGSSYTAWSAIKLLKAKGYVWQNGSPPRFSLTETGEAMAEQLRVATNNEDPSTTAPRRTITSSQHSNDNRSQSNAMGPPEIDLSLYVSDPDAFRRERGIAAAATTSSSTAAVSTPATSEVDLSLYVSDPDAFRRERAASSSATPATTSTSTAADVDLSLYVLDPDAFQAKRAATSTTRSRPLHSPPTTANRVQPSFYTNLDDDEDDTDDDEPTIDLSHDISNPATYRQTTTKIPVGRNSSDRLSQSQPVISSTCLHLPSKRRADPTDDVEVITLLSPTPSPSSSPVRPNMSLHSSQPQESSSALFQYTYLDTSGDQVRHVSQAAVEIDNKRGCLMYKIQFAKHQKQHTRLQSLVNINYTTCTAYFLENDADVVCPGLPARPLLPLHHQDGLSNDFWPDLSSSSQPTTTNSQQSTTCIDRSSQQTDKHRHVTAVASTLLDTIMTDSSRAIAVMTGSPRTTVAPLVSPTTSGVESVPDIPMMVASTKQQGRIWQPTEYTIVMILDNREVKMKTNREYIQDTLLEKGVAVEKRALDVGDVLWVAKHMETKEEMYLDIVLERKRMDDLVSSVKDGRFHEQKYRLKQSTSRKVFYVVEEYNKEAALKFGAQAIQTAMSCVQAVDQFFLKRTGNIDETIDYLVRLTKMIGKLYKDVKLQEIPIHLINRTNYATLKKALTEDESVQQRQSTAAATHHVIPYTIFNQLNSKSGSSTLQDLYTKMLMTIRGVNAEKANALIRAYSTPYHLLKAMDEAVGHGTDPKQLAVHATRNGISRRRWGSSISERLWEVWGKQH